MQCDVPGYENELIENIDTVVDGKLMLDVWDHSTGMDHRVNAAELTVGTENKENVRRRPPATAACRRLPPPPPVFGLSLGMFSCYRSPPCSHRSHALLSRLAATRPMYKTTRKYRNACMACTFSS